MLRWVLAIPLVYLAAVAFVVSSIPPSAPSQPIQFSHKLHLDYFHDGRHRQAMISLHKELLLKALEDETIVSGMMGDIEKGYCTICHRDFDTNARNLAKLSACAQCHRAFAGREWEGQRDVRPCMGCHNAVLESPQASIPNINTCAACHVPTMRGGREETKLAGFIEQEQMIPWTRVYDYLPGDIVFSHLRHVELGHVKCQECHGPVERAERPLSLEVKLSMEDCMDCHQALKADNDCLACHK